MSFVVQTVKLGSPPWPTIDPFLFCVHHLDRYPAGDAQLGLPRDVLAGRNIGSDFSGRDGWSMYHGNHVPGFPQHPHRGFETVTLARHGFIDHSDSLGARARFGEGDVQWMTAGKGIVHCEMFPMVNRDRGNHTELFQIWMNLPAADKMVDPYFTMLWNETIPVLQVDGGEVVLIAGTFGTTSPEQAPPPNSWASRPDADVAIWTIRLDAGASVELPAATSAETVRTLYSVTGGSWLAGGDPVEAGHAAVVRPDVDLTITADHAESVELLMLQGRPIGEPVARYGPFVMNSDDEIRQAYSDYQRTGFGGWPWDRDDPVHGAETGRFAMHADGRYEEAGAR